MHRYYMDSFHIITHREAKGENVNNPLIVFRVGWMNDYSGIGEIVGGGSHIDENGEGGEMWNFREEAGRYYGYVMSRNFAGIDLRRVSPEYEWDEGDELNDVDIVFISTHPEGGQVVIGWYLNATVFHKEYRQRRGERSAGDWNKIYYLSEVSSDSAKLLPVAERTFLIPKGKGFPGTSNVWYGDDQSPMVLDFKNKLRCYIHQFEFRNEPLGRPNRGNSSKELILAIEKAAVNLTWDHYKALGFEVVSVENDNVGWDLEASKNGRTLLVEVKGHKGNAIQFELTPNEYSQMRIHQDDYRICVVRNALNEPDLIELFPTEDEEFWYLEDIDGSKIVRLQEKIAAKAVQIGF